MRRERVLKNGDEPVVLVRPFTMVPNVIELSYYSSALLSQFVLDSVVGECNCHPVYAVWQENDETANNENVQHLYS